MVKKTTLVRKALAGVRGRRHTRLTTETEPQHTTETARRRHTTGIPATLAAERHEDSYKPEGLDDVAEGPDAAQRRLTLCIGLPETLAVASAAGEDSGGAGEEQERPETKAAARPKIASAKARRYKPEGLDDVAEGPDADQRRLMLIQLPEPPAAASAAGEDSGGAGEKQECTEAKAAAGPKIASAKVGVFDAEKSYKLEGLTDVAEEPDDAQNTSLDPCAAHTQAPAGLPRAGSVRRDSLLRQHESFTASLPADVDPEVLALLQELEERVVALEALQLDAVPLGSVHASISMMLPTQADAGPVTVELNPAQQRAVRGLAGNVHGLLDCLDERHREELKQLERKHTKDEEHIEASLLHLDASFSAPLGRRRNAGIIPSMLADLAVPRGGLVDSLQQMAALSQIYGGVEPPPRRGEPGTLTKSHSEQVRRTHEWTRPQAKAERAYLPQEFGRLGPQERQSLAEALSWEGLAEWGFDAFAVERLSRVAMHTRKSVPAGEPVRLCHFGTAATPAAANPGDAPREGEDAEDITQQLNESCAFTTDDSEYVCGPDGALRTEPHGCPLVLVGWAVLASPYAQLAMARSVGDAGLLATATEAIERRAHAGTGKMSRVEEGTCVAGEEDSDDPGGHFIPDELEVSPRAVCRFLRRVERSYSPRSALPYHSNVHAADVLQATHALLRLGGPAVTRAYTPPERYAILLAAALHDIRHPGTNNNYQVNAMTELAIRYNDVSVLENMHASRASDMLEADVRGTAGEDTHGILGALKREQRRAFRTDLVRAILYTDMSLHFSHMGAMGGHIAALEAGALRSGLGLGREDAHVLAGVGKDEHAEARAAFLPFLLHMADISNPARPAPVSAEWAAGVYEEFFLQGDREAREGLPVSPLCDRRTTCPYESQVGFMRFVIQPAFALLARVLPEVEGAVLTHLEDNFGYWEEKVKAKGLGGEEGAPASPSPP